MDRPPEQPDPDPLDRLLQEARWAEPSPETIARLRASWKDLMAARARRRRRALAAVAATALAAASVLMCMRSEHEALPPRPTPVTAFPPVCRGLAHFAESSEQNVPVPFVPTKNITRPAAARTSRPPNPYERLVLVAYRRARRDAEAREESPAVLHDEPQAANRAIEHVDAGSVQTEMVHRAALRANSKTLDRLIQDAQVPEVRSQLLSILLTRGDRQSVEIFLGLVEDPDISAAALDCLESVSHPPAETLLRYLHSPIERQRLAAARVLGHLNRPEVSRELIQMVLRGVHRQEAMIALLSSSEATAQAFLAGAAQDPALSAALWNAKRQFQTPFPRRS